MVGKFPDAIFGLSSSVLLSLMGIKGVAASGPGADKRPGSWRLVTDRVVPKRWETGFGVLQGIAQ